MQRWKIVREIRLYLIRGEPKTTDEVHSHLLGLGIEINRYKTNDLLKLYADHVGQAWKMKF